MRYLLEKDKKKRRSFFENENLFSSLSFLKRFGETVPLKNSIHVLNKQHIAHGKQFGKCYPKNRCIFTNRPRSVYRVGRVSRIKFRSYSLFGFLTGIQKSSW